MKLNSIRNGLLLLGISALLFTLDSCLGDSSMNSSSVTSNTNTGIGGSMARFTTVDDYMYCVDNTTLRIFSLSQGTARYIKQTTIGVNVETIFARGNVLFMGTSNGVYIYSIEKRDEPVQLSLYQHIVSCDPVVADDKFAYATLRTERTRCDRGINALDVINISNLKNPFLVYRIDKSQPKGLGLYGDRLVVCNNGIELINVKDRIVPFVIQKNNKVVPNDVILLGTKGIGLLDNGLVNFDFSNDSIKIVGQLTY